VAVLGVGNAERSSAEYIMTPKQAKNPPRQKRIIILLVALPNPDSQKMIIVAGGIIVIAINGGEKIDMRPCILIRKAHAIHVSKKRKWGVCMPHLPDNKGASEYDALSHEKARGTSSLCMRFL